MTFLPKFATFKHDGSIPLQSTNVDIGEILAALWDKPHNLNSFTQ